MGTRSGISWLSALLTRSREVMVSFFGIGAVVLVQALAPHSASLMRTREINQPRIGRCGTAPVQTEASSLFLAREMIEIEKCKLDGRPSADGGAKGRADRERSAEAVGLVREGAERASQGAPGQTAHRPAASAGDHHELEMDCGVVADGDLDLSLQAAKPENDPCYGLTGPAAEGHRLPRRSAPPAVRLPTPGPRDESAPGADAAKARRHVPPPGRLGNCPAVRQRSLPRFPGPGAKHTGLSRDLLMPLIRKVRASQCRDSRELHPPPPAKQSTVGAVAA